jgi:hypothetical protein
VSTDPPLFLDVEDDIELHAAQLEIYGGAAGVRDRPTKNTRPAGTVHMPVRCGGPVRRVSGPSLSRATRMSFGRACSGERIIHCAATGESIDRERILARLASLPAAAEAGRQDRRARLEEMLRVRVP